MCVNGFGFHHEDGRILCHNCYNRVMNSYGVDVCKLDEKRVEYKSPCRFNYKNPTKQELEESAKKMEEKLKKWCEENPNLLNRVDWDNPSDDLVEWYYGYKL